MLGSPEQPPPFVTYERLICNDENPRRCRKVGKFYWDGIVVCEDHTGRIPESMRRFVRPIERR